MAGLSLAARSALVMAILGVAAALPQPVRGQQSEVTQVPTTLRSYDGRTLEAVTLRIPVPLRRPDGGRRIAIQALRIPSSAAKPGPPIVFLMGGPGIPGSVMAPIPPYFTLFTRLQEQADVVIVDQRGVGQSEPALDCRMAQGLPTEAFADRPALVAALTREVKACADDFRTKGLDPTAFTTLASAADLDDLRRALGAERIDLLAFSYGSRLALTYLQQYGDHVRRMVLQGVNGPGQVLKRPSSIRTKLERLSALLKADESWIGRSDLVSAARSARERLDRSPVDLSVADSRTGQTVQLRVGRDGLDALVHLNLDDPRLPALLISVAANDDRVLQRFVEAAWNGFSTGQVGLLGRAVNCAADRPLSRMAIVREESSSSPFGNPIDNAFLTDDFCRDVGYTSAQVEFSGPVTSQIPVLLITGGLDATNPLSNATEVAAGFQNAVLLEVENAAHEALPVESVQEAVVDWFLGRQVGGRRLSTSAPRFLSVDEASKAPAARGR